MQNTLSKVGLRWYRTLRTVLVLIFFGVAIFVVVKTVFPNGGGYFNFISYGSGKNSLADPRYEDGTPIERGIIRSNATMIVNASALGDFSRADIIFRGTGASIQGDEVSLVQAYRAFLYPLGDPVVCPREGSLVALEGEYAIVSRGKIRPFLSGEDISRRGYRSYQFAPFLRESLSLCPWGENIQEDEKVVSGMIVVTDEGFSQFLEGEWISYVSNSAFQSRYRSEDALAVSRGVFLEYPISENVRGFLDGVLVSYGESVYVVEGETLRPIDSIDTFLAKGYRWQDVVPLNGEEFGMYTRGKLYTKREPHPSGTIFIEEKTGKMFLVENKKRREIIFPELQKQFSSVNFLPASVVDLGGCPVHSGWFSDGCTIDWSGKARGVGAEYQLLYRTHFEKKFASMEVIFFREKNLMNWSLFLSETMGKLRSRYPFL